MASVTFGCVGDVHGAVGRLEQALEWLESRRPDALLLVGDFTRGVPPAPWRNGAVAEALEPVRRCLERAREAGPPVLFVPGNHDVPDVPLEGNADRRLARVAGVRIYGIGGAGPARMGFPYEWTDRELAELQVPPRDLLLTHAPPVDTTLDRTVSGEHVGSRVIRTLAEDTRGALVCGHIHESPGVELLGACLCYNAGALGGVHGRLQAGTLELDPATGGARARHYVEDGGRWEPVADDAVPGSHG